MKNVLAVDDNPANLTLVRETLQGIYKVSVVTSGSQALRFMERKKADLILLDLYMPEMDGLEVLKAFKEKGYGGCPIIMLTAIAENDTLNECKKLGAVDCILKPFQPQDMLAKLKELIGE